MSRHLALVERFAAGGALLNYATSGLTAEQAEARPGPGAWSLNELVVHVVDTDLVMADRIKRILAEDSPTLLAFDQSAWNTRFGAMDLAEAVPLLVANRVWMTRVLGSGSEADFSRVGQHSEAGPLSLAEVVARAVGHLDHHLRFLYGKRANLGSAIAPHYAPQPSTVR